MNLIEINQESCNQDGICAAVCPMHLLDFEKGQIPKPIDHADELCIRCGHCVTVCPTSSLSHREMASDQCLPVQKELLLSEAQCEQFLRNRRSIRVYKDKPVSKEDLQRLIEIARYAPSGHNTQTAEWLVLANKDDLQKYSGIIVDWLRWMVANMPEFAASMHMEDTITGAEKDMNVILRDAPVVIVAHAHQDDLLASTTGTIALTYLELAATGMGLGCCWAGFFNAASTTFPAMMEALSLPEGHKSLGAMMVGYPKFRYQRLPMRNTPKIIWRL